MKTTRYYLCLISILFLSSLLTSIKAQTDTLHLDYSGIQTVLPDTTEAKLNEWAKKINGKKYEVVVFAYYHDKDFKKFADERADDMFRILNRKAREWITIKNIESKKGKKFQRSRVDIVYSSLVPESKTEEVKKESTATASKTSDEQKNKTSAKENKETSEKKAKKEKSTAKKEDASAAKADIESSDSLKTKETTASSKEYYAHPGKIEAGRGDFVNRSDLDQIKKSKLIVALTGSFDTDSFLVNDFKRFWQFTSNITFMKYQDAVAQAKTDENIVIFAISGTYSRSLLHGNKNNGNYNYQKQVHYRYISEGASVMIEKIKGNHKRILISQPIPLFSEEKLVYAEALAFGITSMNYLLTTMSDNDLGSNLKYERYYKAHAPELKKSILYLPDYWLHEKLDTAKISQIYTSPYKIVPFEVWSKAILNKEDVTYSIIAPEPIGGTVIYMHYLVNAKNGRIYGQSSPKGAGTLMLGPKQINLSKGNSGFINKSNIDAYEDISNGKW